MNEFIDKLIFFAQSTGFTAIVWQQIVMIAVGLFLIYLAIKKEYEPLLLIPIGFGCILSNLPMTGLNDPNGLLRIFYKGIESGLFPPLIFLGIGALTDFSPLLSNPKTFLLGAAAQFGIFMSLLGALCLKFTLPEACSIGIIGGADGPTTIYTTSKLAPHLLGPIAVVGYSYMALVPIIQPPIMKLLTTKKERAIVMKEKKNVSQTVKIIFPLAILIISALFVPASAPLIGMLALGNLFREAGCVDRLSKTAQNELINIVTIFLGIAVGTKMNYQVFLSLQTIYILILGFFAFSFSTAAGVVFGKIMSRFSKDPVNPLIGAAGVSAVPMAARVVHKVGQEENPDNYLLMHAMGPNVAGVIGSAIVAGVLLSIK